MKKKYLLTLSLISMGVAHAQQMPLPGMPYPPSMMQNNSGSNGINNNKDLPPASASMNMNNSMIQQEIDKSVNQSDKRLAQLSGESSGENLPAPDLSDMSSELKQMQNIERKTRLLTAQQKEADAAVKLWSTLFNKKEDGSGASSHKEASSNDTAMIASLKKELEDMKHKDISVGLPKAPQTLTKQEMSLNASKAKNFIPPEAKVVIISGSGQKKVATLLIPYVGEQDVKIGDKIPGGRTIYSISELNGVTVQEKDGSHTILSFGASVPGDNSDMSNTLTATTLGKN